MALVSEIRDRYVYALIDEQGLPFYIGAGKGNRLDHHVGAAKGTRKPANPTSAKHLYLVDCIKRGYFPVACKIAENLTIKEAFKRERALIAKYGRRDLGTGCLFNTCDGGFGIKNYSAETRAKISLRTKEGMTPEIRAHISRKGKARFIDPQERAKVSASTRKQFVIKGHPKLGKKLTSEIRMQISSAVRKTMAQPELRAKISQKVKEALASPEMRALISKNSKSHWTPEKRIEQAKRMRSVTRSLSVKTNTKRIINIKAFWTSEKRIDHAAKIKRAKQHAQLNSSEARMSA